MAGRRRGVQCDRMRNIIPKSMLAHGFCGSVRVCVCTRIYVGRWWDDVFVAQCVCECDARALLGALTRRNDAMYAKSTDRLNDHKAKATRGPAALYTHTQVGFVCVCARSVNTYVHEIVCVCASVYIWSYIHTHEYRRESIFGLLGSPARIYALSGRVVLVKWFVKRCACVCMCDIEQRCVCVRACAHDAIVPH